MQFLPLSTWACRPWVHDDKFLFGIKTLLESLGLSKNKQWLRGCAV